ncbi:hypothetical protein [Bacillus aerolatus]|uniref:hypothetical protein n=1 Tax=Bacillus aerolatus TaxID=2653354 RepID=UPI00384A8FA1
MARTIGVTVKKIPLKITEGGDNEEQRPMVLAFSQSSPSDTTPPIQIGEFTINANAKAIFQYSNKL